MLPGGQVKNAASTTMGVEEYISKVKEYLASDADI